jgi:hypothetical protein
MARCSRQWASSTSRVPTTELCPLSSKLRICRRLLLSMPLDPRLLILDTVQSTTNHPCRPHKAIATSALSQASRTLARPTGRLHGGIMRHHALLPAMEPRRLCLATTHPFPVRLQTVTTTPRLRTALMAWACPESARSSTLPVPRLPAAWQAPQCCHPFANSNRARNSWAADHRMHLSRHRSNV